ncbi:hypothetical protein MMC14_003121 [Varicellaria rhodocarpa]|nr:hypothetical protein [Varicellaria rhodocarpa]
MNNQYYHNSTGGPATTTAETSIHSATNAESTPHGPFGAPGYPYEDPSLHHGNTNYLAQEGLGGPSIIDQQDNVIIGSTYEYFSGPILEEDFEMPESQRAIAKERRKAQNRTAQKAFRHRKETRIKELEQRLEVLEKDYKSLEKAFEDLKVEKEQLRTEIEQLSTDNANLRGSAVPSSTSSAGYNVSPWPSISYIPRDPQHAYAPPEY